MKGEILFEKMTNISDEYVTEAAMGEAYGNPRAERKDGGPGRFLNSGWGVAAVCALVSVMVIVVLVRWGGAGAPIGPAGSTDTEEGADHAQFTFSYHISDENGTPQATATMLPGDSFTVNATVTNNGLPFVYVGSSGGFCPDVRFVHYGEEKNTVLHGGIFLSTDVGTHLVETGEVGYGSYFVEVPVDAPAGSYDLILSYKNDEQVYTGVLTVEKEASPVSAVVGNYLRSDVETEMILNHFSISLNEDGTFVYIANLFSSHIGHGRYTEEDNVITLKEGDAIHKFRYENDRLIFLAEESDQFLYVTLPDGATFDRIEIESTPVIPELKDHPLTLGYENVPRKPVRPGDRIELTAYVINQGDPIIYDQTFRISVSISLWDDSGNNPSTSYTIHGGKVVTGVEEGYYTIYAGDRYEATYSIQIPTYAPAGSYALTVSFEGKEEWFPDVLEVSESAAPHLDSHRREQICNAYAISHRPLDPAIVSVVNYYGQYPSNALVAMINDGSDVTDALWEEQVGPATIRYKDGNRIQVYHNRAFYTLPEAYENGYLSDSDLADIENLQRRYYDYLYADPEA